MARANVSLVTFGRPRGPAVKGGGGGGVCEVVELGGGLVGGGGGGERSRLNS